MKYIGNVSQEIKNDLKIETCISRILWDKENLINHMRKKNHICELEYVDKIKDIIKNPDYIGINPREKGVSLEYIKVLDDNVLIGIKLDSAREYFYISTMHKISDLKLRQRIKVGRIKEVDN